ncbi:MAG TPA: XcyI family restriction endonuclease [Verrucomicrobiota bacterium]|nr:XcyI family restriction endonuclease [Verrucomicrobiota bacterium]
MPQSQLAAELETFRRRYLQEALRAAVAQLDLHLLNAQLDGLVPADALKQVAAAGIRGELVFATPLLLTAQPRLLGYYRLLLGYSQKELYHKGGLGRFRCLEEGRLSDALQGELPALCRALVERAATCSRASASRR